MPASGPVLSPQQVAAVEAAALPRLVAAGPAAGNVVTGTTETAFATRLTIPGGTLGPGLAIRDRMFGHYTSAGVMPSIVPRIRLGGVSLLPARPITGLLASANAPWCTDALFIVTAQGILGTGMLSIDDNQSRIFGAATLVTGLNFAADLDLTGSAQWAQPGCAITLQGRLTEVLRAA